MTPDTHPTEQLATRAAQGDLDALGELYDAWVDRTHRYAYIRLGSPSDAEDATAEIWLRIARGIRTYRPRGGGWAAWIFTIAAHVVASHGAARSRRRDHELPSPCPDALPEVTAVASAEDQAVSLVVADRVAEAVSRLPGKQRDVVTLRFYGGLSLAETAAVIGRSVGAVKQLQHRAMLVLHADLGDLRFGGPQNSTTSEEASCEATRR